ncbi:MAG: prepilin-type N-terminal cleavage/methylation domain-containing protein [Planctomycetales bacterium]
MKRSRAAFTLIEMLVVTSVLAVLMVIGCGLLHAMAKLDGAWRDGMTESLVLDRLTEQFRRDVHLSVSATTSDDDDKPPQLLLTARDGKTVAYESESNGILRVERRGDAITARETYRLPSCQSARFTVSSDADQPSAALVMRRRLLGEDSLGDEASAVEFRVQVGIGWDLRFDELEGESR